MDLTRLTEKRPLIILTGPTAVGKTALSIALAKAVGGEIISADSMQVYRHMDIGSAKITPEEMKGVPHHLIDVLEPTQEFNVAVFQEMAKQAAKEIYERGHIPIVVGGTGFYIQALLYDIDFTEYEKGHIGNSSAHSAALSVPRHAASGMCASAHVCAGTCAHFSGSIYAEDDIGHKYDEDTALRRSLEELADREGADALYERLRAVDPESCESIHANNVKRVIRAIEFYEKTGKKISDHNREQRQNRSPYRFAYFVLNDIRERIYQRIDERVDLMMEHGLVEEVRALHALGCHSGMVSMQGLGYKQILLYLEGEISLDEAVYLTKRDTRHFAKRQLTWFRREKEVTWVEKNVFDYDSQKILGFMQDFLREKEIIL